MRLSQGHLNLLTTCPRKFQHLFLDQLGSIDPEQQARLEWGSRFHLLMQQRELGLPIERLTRADDQMQQWVMAFLSAAAPLFEVQPGVIRQSEHRRTLEFAGHLLTVVYDLLILAPDRADILDWKTYPRPRQRHGLATNWQTRLYLFLLAETSDYVPEQISLSYWFVQAVEPDGTQPQPQMMQFTYNQDWHDQTRHDLARLLHHLDEWRSRYETQGEPFPQTPPDSRACVPCPFTVRCQRQPESEPLREAQPLTIAEIAEVIV